MGKRESAQTKRAAKPAAKTARANKTKTTKPNRKSASGGKRAALALLLLLLLTAGVYLFLCARVEPGKLLDGTSIGHTDLSGMTMEEAEAALLADFDQTYRDASLTLRMPGQGGGSVEVEVPLWRADHSILWLDTEAVLQEAMSRSEGPFLTRGLEWIKAQLSGWQGEAKVSLHDGDALREVVAATGLLEVDTRVETTYTVEEDAILIQKGQTGLVADGEATASAIAALVNSGQWPETSLLDCATVASQIEALDVEQIYLEVFAEPRDATLDRENNYQILPSVTGVRFDLAQAKEALASAEPGSQVEIPLEFTEPEITTQDLEENLFKDVLGSYSTTVTGASGRRANVKLSAEYCNGTILLVGEEFSYNEVVGQRTKARGFSEAPAYVNGLTVQEVGGGICQTSSTLYAACLYANLEIVQRTNHSFASSYIGLGLDATVSWGGPEFIFRNNTKYPIKVAATYEGGKVKVQILGTKTDDITVKIVSKTLETIPFSTRYEEDDSLYEGETRTITTAYTGYKVQTYRELYDGDGNLISSEEEAYSNYKKRDKVIAKGTKEKKDNNDDNDGGED